MRPQWRVHALCAMVSRRRAFDCSGVCSLWKRRIATWRCGKNRPAICSKQNRILIVLARTPTRHGCFLARVIEGVRERLRRLPQAAGIANAVGKVVERECGQPPDLHFSNSPSTSEPNPRLLTRCIDKLTPQRETGANRRSTCVMCNDALERLVDKGAGLGGSADRSYRLDVHRPISR